MTLLGYVVPTLGRDMAYLSRAVDSILSQSIRSEIVLVAPKSAINVYRFAASRNLVCLEDNELGVAAAFNVGIKYLEERNFKYFSVLGEDDELLAGSTASLIEILETDNKCQSAVGNTWYVDDSGKVLFHNSAPEFSYKFIHFIPNVIPHPGSISRISAWRKIGCFKENLVSSMDLDFWLEVMKFGTIRKVDCPMSLFRWHQGGYTASNRKLSIREAAYVRKFHRGKFSNFFYSPLDLFFRTIGEKYLQSFVSKI